MKTMNTNNNTNKNTNTNKAAAIEFTPIALKNERVLLYDVRCALIDRNNAALLSLCKAWIHAKDNGVVSDADVMRVADALKEVCYRGKLASVKARQDGKEAVVEAVSTSRVKAWMYTIRRNGYKPLEVASEKGERPEEKAVRTPNRKTTVKLSAEDAELFRLVVALRDAGLDTDSIKAALALKAKAC